MNQCRIRRLCLYERCAKISGEVEERFRLEANQEATVRAEWTG
jgi:hypothetical protein